MITNHNQLSKYSLNSPILATKLDFFMLLYLFTSWALGLCFVDVGLEKRRKELPFGKKSVGLSQPVNSDVRLDV